MNEYFDPLIDILWAIIRGGITGIIIALVGAHYMKKYMDDMDELQKLSMELVSIQKEKIYALEKEIGLLKFEVSTLKEHDKWCTMNYEDRFLVKPESLEKEIKE